MKKEMIHLTAARNGDLAAFNQLVLEYQDAVYNYVDWILNDSDQAEDITQEVFLHAFEKLQQQQKNASFRAWLFRNTTNTCLEELHRKKPILPLSLIARVIACEAAERFFSVKENGSSTKEDNHFFVITNRLEKGLRNMPVFLRAVLILIDVYEFSYIEAAYALNATNRMVRNRLSQARQSLRNHLSSNEEFSIEEVAV